jgi:hypothetical protein
VTFSWKEIRGKEAVAKLNTILRRGLQYSALHFFLGGWLSISLLPNDVMFSGGRQRIRWDTLDDAVSGEENKAT